jgi:Domain of unknown function (DUF1996)
MSLPRECSRINHHHFTRTVPRIITIALTLATTTATAQELTPSADATIRGGRYATANMGRSPSLAIKNSAFGQHDHSAYLKFDLEGIDRGIQRAVLALSVHALDGDTVVRVNATTDGWDEQSIRWRSRPSPGIALATRPLRQQDRRELLVDVTEYVRAEARKDGQASFVLSAPRADERHVSFGSRESKDAPILVIDRSGGANGTPASMQVRTQSTARAPQVLTWTQCANEGQVCRLPGADNEARKIRYGTTDQYVERIFFKANHWLGDVRCSTAVFGRDPAPGQAKRCEYSSVLVKELSAPTHPMGPAIDRSRIPVGDPGTVQVLARQTTEQTGASDGTGAFRIVCMYSHMNFDDAIVYPGQPGRSHLHTYFGNTGADANSTHLSLRHTGNATCNGGILNRSAYWVPAVIDTRSGSAIAPRSNIVYYKTGYSVPAASIQPFPTGLRMIAGDMLASSAQEFASWSCGEHTLRGGAIPANCPAGQDLSMTLIFPQCWDGANLDAPDHKSHMAYPRDGRCPTSHPIALPEITYNVHYSVPDAAATTHWRLSSDMYGTDKSGGFSIHGDWINGWDEAAMRIWVERCDVAARDCHAHLLGDGREIYYDPNVHQVDPTASRGSQPIVRPRR